VKAASRGAAAVAKAMAARRSFSEGEGAPGDKQMTDKIYLVGFMAAGKTTVARALAERLGWRAEDVDELIEARERKPVADIFQKEGEPHFRAVEREILKLLLPLRHVVVATGGGTFMDPENRAAINMDGVSVWLDLPFEALLTRIPQDGRRPLAADRAAMERLFAMRLAAYSAARVRVDAAARPEEVAERIIECVS
jgi:shikimate kinase